MCYGRLARTLTLPLDYLTHLSAESPLIHVAFVVQLVGVDSSILYSFTDPTPHLQRLDDELVMCSVNLLCEMKTFVITTISSRGILCFLIALPRITSERPFE